MLQKSKVPHMKLQIYHHAAVVPMAWFWCQYQQSLQWGGLLFNTFVHILMYSYYCCRVMGWKTPWKRYLHDVGRAFQEFSCTSNRIVNCSSSTREFESADARRLN
eukprot:4103390-Amphidinium_carterae.1